MKNAATNFDILATSAFYIITLIVQQNYFSDPAKILDLLAKLFFSSLTGFLYIFCMHYCFDEIFYVSTYIFKLSIMFVCYSYTARNVSFIEKIIILLNIQI